MIERIATVLWWIAGAVGVMMCAYSLAMSCR